MKTKNGQHQDLALSIFLDKISIMLGLLLTQDVNTC